MPINNIDELVSEILKYIKSSEAVNLFNVNGKDYIPQFSVLFDTDDKLKAAIKEYLNFITLLPNNKLSDLMQQPIDGTGANKLHRLGSQIIRSIISQLGQIEQQAQGAKDVFDVRRSVKIFSNPDANDYMDGNIPTLKAQFVMMFQWLFSKARPDNKLVILKPRDEFNALSVAKVLEGPPKELPQVLEDLRSFSEVDDRSVKVAANIFSGIIAKLAGKTSPFRDELPENLIKAAKDISIKLALICCKDQQNIVISADDAITIGKVVGKASRQELFDNLPHAQKSDYEIMLSNIQNTIRTYQPAKKSIISIISMFFKPKVKEIPQSIIDIIKQDLQGRIVKPK